MVAVTGRSLASPPSDIPLPPGCAGTHRRPHAVCGAGRPLHHSVAMRQNRPRAPPSTVLLAVSPSRRHRDRSSDIRVIAAHDPSTSQYTTTPVGDSVARQKGIVSAMSGPPPSRECRHSTLYRRFTITTTTSRSWASQSLHLQTHNRLYQPLLRMNPSLYSESAQRALDSSTLSTGTARLGVVVHL